MTFCKKLDTLLDSLFLLKHPYYQAWNDGQLSMESLKTYAKEYYHHVAAFPRYISQIHALCPDIKARQILLANLKEEEEGEDNHPELWLRFAQGLGNTRAMMQQPALLNKTNELVVGYFDLVKTDYATGLGALYAYERQTPQVSSSKIEGLKKHYGIHDARTLEFFTVHEKADEWHTEEIAALIEQLSPQEQEKASQGAHQGAQLLWAFLDGIMENTMHNTAEVCSH